MGRLVSRLAWWGFAAILATGVVVAAAMGLAAWHRAPDEIRPLTLPPLATTRPSPLVMPERLGPARAPRSFVDATFAKLDEGRPAATGAVELRLEGWSEGLVVSVISASTGACLVASEAREPVVRLEHLLAGSYWITAAPSGSSPRYAYLARTKLDLASGQEAKAILACERSDVRVLLASGTAAAELSVAREDDPRWLLADRRLESPASRPARGSEPTAAVVVRGLAAGRYSATARGKSASFEVPRDATIDLR